MDEMKPCPFCGGEARIKERYREGISNRLMYWTECKKCGVTQANHALAGYNSRVKAANAWNKRIITDCPTIYGYDVRHLTTFADACQVARIKVEDLSELFGNMSTAIETVARIINEHTERIITEYMKNPIPAKEPVNGFRGAHMEVPDDGDSCTL